MNPLRQLPAHYTVARGNMVKQSVQNAHALGHVEGQSLRNRNDQIGDRPLKRFWRRSYPCGTQLRVHTVHIDDFQECSNAPGAELKDMLRQVGTRRFQGDPPRDVLRKDREDLLKQNGVLSRHDMCESRPNGQL